MKTPYSSFYWLINLAIITGLTSVILVMLLRQSRIFYIMSKDGFVPLVPILGIVSCLIFMFSFGWFIWIQLILWLTLGICLYLFYGKKHSHLN